MNIHQLKAFLCVAQTQSITKAAKQMHMTQQALSRIIAKLEDELGTALFRRLDRQTVLTVVGQRLLPVAQSLIQKHEEHEALMREIVDQNAHNISIAFENTVLLNSFPADLLARIGDIRISAYLQSDNNACIRDVLSGKATCAFVGKPEDLQGLEYMEVIHRYPTVIMSHKHALAKKQQITIEDLRNENHAWLSVNSPFFTKYYSACIHAGFYPKITKEYPSVELLHRDLPNGMEITVGLGIISKQMEPELVHRPLICDSCMMEAGFIYCPEDAVNKNLISYFQVVKETLNTK